MSETWTGLIIVGSALSIAMFMVIGHYRRERARARMLQNLNHHEWWHLTRRRT